MKYLKIQNKGELDVRLIALMGGTTKKNDTYKIGQFGTGLKYTLAWLLRNNVQFKIFSGQKEVPISTESENIAGQDFDIIHIQGQRTSITTNMGEDWKGWMIVREIWCNALDEGEPLRKIEDKAEGRNGCTTFYIQLTGEILQTWKDWDNYFIHNQEPLWENNNFAIYPGSNHMHIYKQGVLIQKKTDKVSLFSYDIKNAEINELREYKGSRDWDIFKALANADAKVVELFLSNLKQHHYEWDLDFSWSWINMSEEWNKAIGQARLICKEDLDALMRQDVEVDSDSMVVVPKGLLEKLSTQFPHVSALRRADKVSSFWEVFDEELDAMIKEGIDLLESCGYIVSHELKFICGHFGNGKVFARINFDEKVVMMSLELKKKSKFDLITALIEENEHYLTSHQDCTREFQQHFINLFTKEILTKHGVNI